MGNLPLVAGKAAGTAFLLLFAVGFSWFGFGMGLRALTGTLGQWYQARSYVAVPASVRSAELKHGDGDSDTRSVQASFAYRYQDRDYTSNRVSSSAQSDNFDTYHDTTYERLRAASVTGETVTLWVDPTHPERAMYDRSLRWKPVLFMIPFAVLFPAVGLGAWVAIFFLWWPKRAPSPANKLLAQSSPGRLAPLAMTLFAFFWNTLSWPIAILVMAGAGSSVGAGALVMLFPAVGLGMLWMAYTMWRTRWRIGNPMLELLHAPDVQGLFPVRGRVHFDPAFATRLPPAQLTHPLRLTVKLLQTVGSGEDAVETTMWESCVTDAAIARGTQHIDWSVMLPSDLLGARPPPSAELGWKLELKALGAEILFDLPDPKAQP